jgi:hypothetical protein
LQVVVAALLGIAVERVDHIKMIVVPVIFCVIVTGIASMDHLRKADRFGGKAIFEPYGLNADYGESFGEPTDDS